MRSQMCKAIVDKTRMRRAILPIMLAWMGLFASLSVKAQQPSQPVAQQIVQEPAPEKLPAVMQAKSQISVSSMLPIQIQIDGMMRRAHFFQPENISPNRPMLVVLHGGGGTSEGMAKVSDFNRIAANEDFSVLYPQGVDKHWNDGRHTANQKVDDVRFINRLVKKMIEEYGLDSSRVFGVGISNGGLMMQKLACDRLDTFVGFKAIATIAATMTENTYQNCKPSDQSDDQANDQFAIPLSVLTIHGTKDKIIPYAGGKVPIGQKGKVVSAQAVLALWQKHNRCSAEIFENNLENTAKDWTRTTLQEYQHCHHAKVVHYKVHNGGHTWPSSPVWQPVVLQGLTSQDFNASLHIWRFFQSLDFKDQSKDVAKEVGKPDKKPDK